MKRLLTVAALSAGIVNAQEEPIVRVDVEPDTVAVGETVRMRVTVLVPTWFPRPPEFPDFELANAITRLPPDSSRPTSERIGGDTWSGIVRNYSVYPLTGATYRISGETVDVTYANPGAAATERSVPVPEVEFRATIPAGAEALDPYIAGRNMTLTMEVDGSSGGLEAGDAVVLRYSAELDGLPAIFLPPLAPMLDVAGVSVYADQPEIGDGPPARRSEKLTLVFDAGGEYSVPPVELDYWNTGTASVTTVAADGLVLSVAGPPAAPEAAGRTSIDWRTVALVAVIGLAFGAGLWRSRPRLRERLARAARERRESEAHAFRELQSALRSARPRAAYERLLEWTARLEPPMDSRELALRHGDERLVRELDALSRSLFVGDGTGVDCRALADGLTAARQRFEHRARGTMRIALPPLNP